MPIPFIKVQGTGNDFVLVDGRRQEADWASLAPAVCDRHFGVGSDGLLVIVESERAPVQMVMYNPDGSEAEMCGNGIRCFVKYVVEQGGVAAPDGRLEVETGAGVLTASFDAGQGSIDRVRIAMGEPRFEPAQIPVVVEGPGPVTDLALTVEGMDLSLTCVSMGNPHAVLFTDTPVASFPLEQIGPAVEHHALFPERTNFEIVNVLSPDHLRVRVWERGAGLTMACGTGACAVQAAARVREIGAAQATLSLPGGDLDVEWSGTGESYLEGPAAYVFEGEWSSNGHA
jgi:diaminopimelate epimerase